MRKFMTFLILVAFLGNILAPLSQAQGLPSPAAGVSLSEAFKPAVIQAIAVHADNPLQFDFYMDNGQQEIPRAEQRATYEALIKDFMTALTIPESDVWVNLSPYEKDRVIEERFGLTAMGRDLLSQDYILKQLTASLLYPEGETGRIFWSRIYAVSQERYGTTDIPLDTLNKVWITPDIAEVYQKGLSAVVVRKHLKVVLGSDHVSVPAASQELSDRIMREVVLPAIEKEVNEGQNFARLRQIYNALILASWYKRVLRESFLGKTYVDRSKVKGIRQQGPAQDEEIYQRYVEAFRRGAYNYIKEDVDRYTGDVIPRRYVVGGFSVPKDFAQRVLRVVDDRAQAVDAAQDARHKVICSFKKLSRQFQRGWRQKKISYIAQELETEEGEPYSLQGRAMRKEMKKALPDSWQAVLERLPELVVLEVKDGKLMIKDQQQLHLQLMAEGLDDVKIIAAMNKALNRINWIRDDLKKCFDEFFEEMLDGHPAKEWIRREILMPVYYGAWSGLQEMMHRGRNIEEIMNLFFVMSRVAESKTEILRESSSGFLSEGMLEDILGRLKLHGALVPLAASIMSRIKDREWLTDLYADISTFFPEDSLFCAATHEGKNDFIKKYRDQNIFWNTETPEIIVNQAQHLLHYAQDRVEALLKNMPHAFYLRAKELDSVKDKQKNGGYALRTMFDFLGGRIVVKGGLTELESMLQQLKDDLEKKGMVVSFINKYKRNGAKGFSADFYRDVKIIISLPPPPGHEGSPMFSGWMLELQIKNIWSMLVADADHTTIYKLTKAKKPVSDVLKDVVWTTAEIINLVEMLNYYYEHPQVGPEETAFILEKMLKDRKLSFPQDAAEKTDNATGGVDARDIGERLKIASADTPEYTPLFSRGRFKDEDVEGFTPMILSVSEIKGIPALGLP